MFVDIVICCKVLSNVIRHANNMVIIITYFATYCVMLYNVAKWYTCNVNILHMMSTSTFMLSDFGQCCHVICTCTFKLSYVRTNSNMLHMFMCDVSMCTCIVMLLYMMYKCFCMLSFVVQCLHVMHTCCIMLRRQVDKVGDVAKCWKVLYKVMRHQENVVRCLHIMYMCVHVL